MADRGYGGREGWRGRGSSIFPDDDDDPAYEAKEICATCIVREACLESAIATREKLGVWGGYTARERRRLVRQRRRAS